MIPHRVLHLAFLTLGMAIGLPVCAQEPADRNQLESTAAAPRGTRSIGSALGGAYFVDEVLLDRYEALKARLAHIREDIASGNASGQEALDSLAQIEEESGRLRGELEKAKILVSAFQVYSQKSEQVFELGLERLVIVTGDDVVVRGWEGPGIKCVIEKIILAKEQPAESEFDAITIHHELSLAADKVGLTRQQRDEQEHEFMQSEAGRALTDLQRANRRELVDSIHHSYDDYVAFQGRKSNVLRLQGLAHQDGNRNLTMRIQSPGGGGTVSSQWQRHATMTIYLPPCEALAVRGSLVGLDVQDVVCDLVLTTHDSGNRKYDGSFAVSGVAGNVTINQVPVRELSQVTGNVRFTATDEFVNSGTRHEGGTRTFAPYETHTTRIDHIGGDLQAEFLRTDLQLSGITGTLDIVNEYGPTQLTLSSFDAERAHRILSHTGRIDVQGPAQVLGATPIYAYTQCGRLHTNLPGEVLENVAFSTGQPLRGWHGFVTPSEERFGFHKIERPTSALENSDRAPGLDLISHAGVVSVLLKD